MNVLPALRACWYPWNLEEGAIDSCEPPCGFYEPNWGPL